MSKRKKVAEVTLEEPRLPQRRQLRPKSKNQEEYLDAMAKNDIVLCIGPAGSGKTSLAVGKACNMLCNKEIDKIIITRPTIDNGKELGALPGTLSEKIHPYLIPIFDEMHIYIGAEKVKQLKDSGVIEVCPLQYMRGRNFHNTFIILDESQNATYKQIKMLITRMGVNSKVVLNGDPTQSDLPKYYRDGFMRCMRQLETVGEGVAICRLEAVDIVRHPLLKKVLEKLVDDE